MQVLLDMIILSAVLLAGVIFTPGPVKRSPTGRAPRRTPSTHPLASGSGGLVLYRRRTRH